jgi:hypothetical protein
VLFTTAPLTDETAFLRGGVKALLAQWVGLPAFAIFLIQLWAAGPEALPRIVLAFELAFAAALFFTRLFQLGVPFTRTIRFGETGAGNFGLVLMMGLGLGVIVVTHIALCLHPIALGSGIVACAVLIVFLWRRLDRLKVAPDRRLLVPHARLVLE